MAKLGSEKSAKVWAPPQAVQPGQILQPSFNVTALEELEGSPYLLSADGKGSVSCWDVSPHLRSNDPLLSFDAHERKISQVLQLRSPRLPQVLEEALWNKTSAAAAATATGGTEVSPKSTKNKIPVQAKSTWRQLLTEKTKKTSWWSGIPSCRSCCCCCCNKGNLPVVHGGPPRSHWLIATGSEDKRLVIWLLREVSSTSPLEVAQISEWCSMFPISGLLELHDGLLAMSFDNCYDVKVVDPVDSTVRWILYGHSQIVTALAECADGRLATGGADGVLRIWEKRRWDEKNLEGRPQELEDFPVSELKKTATTSDSASPPRLAQEAWSADAKPGVCSMAFYAHHQQAQRAETAALYLRVLVHSARYLPKVDGALVVSCTVLDTREGTGCQETTARTESSRTGSWNEILTVKYERMQIGASAEPQLAECSMIELEVMAGSVIKQEKSHRTLARCSIPLAEVLEDSKPMARKLYSPLGQGPFEELQDAQLLLSFSTAFGDRLNINIMSVKGMQTSITKPMYVRATCRQNCASNVQSLPTDLRHGVTGSCLDTSKPQWQEVMQFEIPVYIGDSHVQMSPDHRLHFQVLSRSQGGDKAVAEMFLPLRSIVENRVKPFELTLLGKGAKSEGKGVASLCLAFQAVVPCPKQLRCRVDCCNKVKYGGEMKNNLQVRMQMVEGDPMLSAEAVRSTAKQSAKPAWKQKCTLPVPEEFLTYGRSLSVRKGWVHEQRDATSLAVCVDIYDRRDDSQGDRFMCRGSVPFREAWEATKNTKGFSTPKTVDLTPSNDGKLQMSFMSNTNQDQLIVNIMSAEKLPGREPSGVCDAYCIVRLAELGQLGEPTDQAFAPMPSARSMPGEVHDSTVLFDQEDVLDLPGVCQDGLVAARPGWHLKFDVIDMKKQLVLCSSSVSIYQVLNEICATEGKDPITNLTIRERIEDAMSAFQKPTISDPFGDEERCLPISKKLILKQLDKPFKRATEQGEMDVLSKPRATQVTDALGSALAFVGLKNEVKEREDLGTDGMELQVSFEVVSRWKGLQRTSRCPPSRWMPGPSPLRCLATLANSMVAGYEDGNVFVWDVTGQSSAPLHQFQAHKVPVSAMAVLTPLNCVVTAGEARNGLEGFSESLLRLWSSVGLELRQSVSLHGQVARCVRPLALGAPIGEIMKAMEAAGKSLEKRDQVLPPCLAVGTDSRQAKQVRLLRMNLDMK